MKEAPFDDLEQYNHGYTQEDRLEARFMLLTAQKRLNQEEFWAFVLYGLGYALGDIAAKLQEAGLVPRLISISTVSRMVSRAKVKLQNEE